MQDLRGAARRVGNSDVVILLLRLSQEILVLLCSDVPASCRAGTERWITRDGGDREMRSGGKERQKMEDLQGWDHTEQTQRGGKRLEEGG